MGRTTFGVHMNIETGRSFDDYCIQVGTTAPPSAHPFIHVALPPRRLPINILIDAPGKPRIPGPISPVVINQSDTLFRKEIPLPTAFL